MNLLEKTVVWGAALPVAILGLILSWNEGAKAGPPRKEVDQKTQLLRQLGSDDYQKREQAQRNLEKIGRGGFALPVKSNTDPEICERLTSIFALVEQRLAEQGSQAVKKAGGHLTPSCITWQITCNIRPFSGGVK